jgi:2-haloacid dehalogenase
MGAMSRWIIDGGASAAHVQGVSRRTFLAILAGSAALTTFGGCAAPASPPRAASNRAPRATTRGICFDLFTIFDPRSVLRVAETVVGERAPELCDAWRIRQFEYSWIRTAAGRYADFEVVTREALENVARARKIPLSVADRELLVGAYSELDPWPDTRSALGAWKERGLKLAPLANYSPRMIERLLAHSELTSFFDTLISTDAVKTFKPDPRAYALGPARLGLRSEEIVFAAFGGWDAAGARWFGFPTFWVNRLSATAEEFTPPPDAAGSTLRELADFVARGEGAAHSTRTSSRKLEAT